MALSVLMPTHDGLVKEEEADEFDYIQDPMILAGLMANGNSPNLHSSFDEVKKELEEEQLSDEERETLARLNESLQDASEKAATGGQTVKEEPIDGPGEDSQHQSDAVNPRGMSHPDYGVAALLSLAAGQDPTGGVEQSAFALFSNKEPKIEEFDEEEKDVSLLEASSIRRKALSFSTSLSLSGEDDERIYLSREGSDLPQRPKRGRPIGPRFSDEEVASDPKKRRQANNREAALRYREKKKVETCELQYEMKKQQDTKEYLQERVDDLSREVHKWKRLCLKVFSFLPEYDFDDHSPLPPPVLPRRSMSSTSESIGSTSPGPDRAAQIRAAASKLRAKRKEEATRRRQEEEQLTARNELLRADALKLYVEIVNLRQTMGFSNAKTSADRDLPSLLRSSQFTSTQISDFLIAQ